MIPDIDVVYGGPTGAYNFMIIVNCVVPIELMVWARKKISDRFCGEPASMETLSAARAYLAKILYELIEKRYIWYLEHKNEWIVTTPLIKWVKK